METVHTTPEQWKKYKFFGVKTMTTISIIDLMKSKKVGEVVTYEELITLCKAKHIDDIRGSIDAAKKYLEASENQCWGTIRNEGYKRLDDSEKLVKTEGYIKRSKNDIKRAHNNMSLIDVRKLDDPNMLKYNMLSGVIMAMGNVGKELFPQRKMATQKMQLPG